MSYNVFVIPNLRCAFDSYFRFQWFPAGSTMHGSASDRRVLEREALRNVIAQWNANRLDLFELSEPNEVSCQLTLLSCLLMGSWFMHCYPSTITLILNLNSSSRSDKNHE